MQLWIIFQSIVLIEIFANFAIYAFALVYFSPISLITSLHPAAPLHTVRGRRRHVAGGRASGRHAVRQTERTRRLRGRDRQGSVFASMFLFTTCISVIDVNQLAAIGLRLCRFPPRPY